MTPDVPHFPGLADIADMVDIYSWPKAGRHVRLNMAINAEAAFVDAQGKSKGLSSQADRSLLKIIRGGADAVVVGASTIRSEGWNMPPTGILVVLSTSGDLPWDSCPDKTRVRQITGNPDASEILRTLCDEGLLRILVEGGRTVARLFAGESLFDDVCLTVSSPGRAPDAAMTENALAQLLKVPHGAFELTSFLPLGASPSVFTLWRRALGVRAVAPH